MPYKQSNGKFSPAYIKQNLFCYLIQVLDFLLKEVSFIERDNFSVACFPLIVSCNFFFYCILLLHFLLDFLPTVNARSNEARSLFVVNLTFISQNIV